MKSVMTHLYVSSLIIKSKKIDFSIFLSLLRMILWHNKELTIRLVKGPAKKLAVFHNVETEFQCEYSSRMVANDWV